VEGDEGVKERKGRWEKTDTAIFVTCMAAPLHIINIIANKKHSEKCR